MENPNRKCALCDQPADPRVTRYEICAGCAHATQNREEAEKRSRTCACCGFEGVETEWYRSDYPKETWVRYCAICAGSFISHTHTYPKNQYDHDIGWLAQQMAYCTNAIIRAIGNHPNLNKS